MSVYVSTDISAHEVRISIWEEAMSVNESLSRGGNFPVQHWLWMYHGLFSAELEVIPGNIYSLSKQIISIAIYLLYSDNADLTITCQSLKWELSYHPNCHKYYVVVVFRFYSHLITVQFISSTVSYLSTTLTRQFISAYLVIDKLSSLISWRGRMAIKMFLWPYFSKENNGLHVVRLGVTCVPNNFS